MEQGRMECVSTTLKVTFNNSGGPLDERVVSNAVFAACAAIEMIKAAGELFAGDSITVEEIGE